MNKARTYTNDAHFVVPIVSGGTTTPYIIGYLTVGMFISLVADTKEVTKICIKKNAYLDDVEIIDASVPVSSLSPDKEYIVEGKKTGD